MSLQCDNLSGELQDQWSSSFLVSLWGFLKHPNTGITWIIVYFSIVEKGEERCKDLIEAHKECMRKAGFNI